MPELRSQPARLAAALAVLGTTLAACSSVTPSMPSFESLFGSGSRSAAANSNALAAYTPPANFECPSVAVRRGAATVSVSANPAEPSALNLRYQFSLGDTARECKLVGSMVSMKVGVRGRIVLGPAGAPGQLDVPLRLAVVREGVEPRTITTKLQRIPVLIPPNDGNVSFSHVEEELTFPMPPGSEIDTYVVYVGFDPQGAEEMDKSRSPRSRRRN
jgi:hypothetical protein